MKVSYYIVFSDPLNSQKERLGVSTRTQILVIVADSIYQSLMNNALNMIPDKEYQHLYKAGFIIEDEVEELEEIIKENKLDIAEENSLYEVIQPSANCQLGCYYCGQKHTKNSFGSDLFEPLLERIRMKAEQKSYKSLYIGWFGGEPLMALNQMRELTFALKNLASEYGMSYGAKVVTNGLSLKEGVFMELVNHLGVDSIEVTLDGIAEFHDKHRYTKEGGNSFDLILKNLLSICNHPEFEKSNCAVSIRCNVDKQNWGGVSPLIKQLSELGLHKKISHFYPIGIYSWSGNDAHKDSLTKEEFAVKEIDWLMEMIEAGFPVSLLPNRTKSVCMVVSNQSEMYDPYGNIFNCTEVSLTDFYEGSSYVMGNLKDNPTPFNKTYRPLSNWNDTLLTDTFPCHTCKMLPVCGGGCPKSWHEDMRACPTPKFNIKDRLALQYVTARSNIQTLLQQTNEIP